MSKTEEKLTKPIVFEKLFKSYNYGNLGMFVGAGFSKAVINNETQPALNWLELIKRVSEILNLKIPEDNQLIGVSLPELSTQLCKELQEKNNIEYEEAKRIFKSKICEISNWLPKEKRLEIFRNIFNKLNPDWIITTNYDLVLETILTGKCISLNPYNYLSAPKGIIPIYHIHGTRLDPNSIVITQDDYIPLFRPNEYRQTKLAMTIRESTTLVLGYGLGDINVLSALDWSKNLYTEKNEYPHDVIQVFWTETPKTKPYRDENGNIIFEINDLETFLEDLSCYLVEEEEKYREKIDILDKFIGKLNEDDEYLVNVFLEDELYRKRLIELLSEFEYNMIHSYIEFFTRCIDRIWKEAQKNNQFYVYDKYLVLIMDIIINYEYTKMPPRLFRITAEALDKVLSYVGLKYNSKIHGQSFNATRTWHNRKKDIPKDMINELYNYADENSFHVLMEFLQNLR